MLISGLNLQSAFEIMSADHIVTVDMRWSIYPRSLWISRSSWRVKSLWYRFLGTRECKWVEGGVSGFMPPCVLQAVSEDKWTLPKAGDRDKVPGRRIQFPLQRPNTALWWKNLHLVAMETSVHSGLQPTVLTNWPQRVEGLKFNSLEKSLHAFWCLTRL